MKCRICGNICESLSKINNTLGNVSILYPKATEKKISNLNIEIFSCTSCHHYQINNIMDENYYDDYIMTTSFSPSIMDLVKSEIELILKHLKIINRNLIVEIGAGDGFFLNAAKNSFKNQIGFEASKAFCLLAQMRGVELINEYYSPTNNYPYINNMNAFVSRQVFEHIENPLETLSSLKKYFQSNGIGLIEVPNGLKIIEESRYYEVFSDHLNYFTPNSLAKLIILSGYELISINSQFNDDYLIAIFRFPKKVDMDFFALNIELDITEKLSSYSNSDKNIALFGIGAKGQQIYHRIKDEVSIKKIFDNDENKIGKFPANCDFSISRPSKVDLAEIDVIIITALTYKQEIIDQLNDDLHFNGEVVLWEDISL